MSDDRITISINWREDSLEQFSKVYEPNFGAMRGFVWRRPSGEYSAHLYSADDEDGERFAARCFADADIAKKWIDIVVAEWARFFEMNNHEIEKEWMEKVRESS